MTVRERGRREGGRDIALKKERGKTSGRKVAKKGGGEEREK